MLHNVNQQAAKVVSPSRDAGPVVWVYQSFLDEQRGETEPKQ